MVSFVPLLCLEVKVPNTPLLPTSTPLFHYFTPLFHYFTPLFPYGGIIGLIY